MLICLLIYIVLINKNKENIQIKNRSIINIIIDFQNQIHSDSGQKHQDEHMSSFVHNLYSISNKQTNIAHIIKLIDKV